MGLKSFLSSALLAAPLVFAHPGHREEAPAHPLERRDLKHCARELNDPELVRRTVEAHGNEYARLRRSLGLEGPVQRRSLQPRDYLSVSRIDHKTNKAVSKNMDASSLFKDAGACILMPAVDEGPLYVKGQAVRKDITEGQPGIRMTVAIQVVDYKTCQVVPNAYVDIWSSNSTGIYTGVQGYPGMGDPKDSSILKLTAFRGVQPTDANGIAVLDTILPGHYEGRATHIHTIVYLGAKKEANGTITGGKAAHIGQIYFDQSLLTAADKVAPYNTNRGAVTLNTNDFLFRNGANGDDPIVRYNFVGSKLEDGLYSWIRFGINQSRDIKMNPAAYWTANGGVMNPTGPVRPGGGVAVPGFGGGFPGFGGKKRAAEAEDEE